MTDSDNSRVAEGAIQALVWAIEEIAKIGDKKAEHYARLALKHLQGKVPDERPTSSTEVADASARLRATGTARRNQRAVKAR